jgi:uncharacterized hydrophobic protein (TIGR00271 family)
MNSTDAGQTRFQRWMLIEERTKPTLYNQVFESSRVLCLNYWLEIVFSAAIATFGLVLNSPAVIIGAMLISPLMSPIMAMGMALSVGDLYLALKAVANLVLSITVSITLSAGMVWFMPFHSATSEILARTNPNLLDLGVAIFSGLAGSIVVSRGSGSGGITALPGVAIAVALMPPLCTMGFGLGSGGNLEIMGGAGLLFLTNLVAIVSSAFFVFLLVGMNSLDVVTEMKRKRRDERFAKHFSDGFLEHAFSDHSQVRWRTLMLVILLGAVAVPLRRALLQVAGETVARSTVQTALLKLAPPDALLSQQVEIGKEGIAISFLSTRAIPADSIQKAEQAISRRTGKSTSISVEEVASKSELAGLMARLNTREPTPPVPPEKSLQDLRKEALLRIVPAITRSWPPEIPVQSFDLALNNTGLTLNVQYQAEKEIGDLPLSMITRNLRDQLKSPDLILKASLVQPPRPARKKVR